MTEWSDDLAEFVEGGELPPIDQELPPIRGADDCDRWLRRIARLREDVAEIERVADAEVERIMTWRYDRVAGVTNDLRRIERHVEQWTRSQLDGANRKSVSLPWGTPSLAKPQTSVTVRDSKAFEAWALESGNEALLLPAKVREPDKRAVAAALRKGPRVESDAEHEWCQLVDENGEVAPGVLLCVPLRDRFSIKATAR